MVEIGEVIKLLHSNKPRIIRLGKEGSWIFAGQIASIIGALMLVRVLTECLEPAEYGQLALGLTIAGFVNQVIMGGIAHGIYRYYSIATEKGDLWSYLRAAKRLMGYATIGLAAVSLVLIVALLVLGHSRWLSLSVTVLIFSFLSGVNSALSSIQNAARQRAIVAIHSGLDAWLKVGLVIGVVQWLGANSTSVMISYVVGAFLVSASQFYFLKRFLQRQSRGVMLTGDQDWGRLMWSFSWPFSASGIFTWFQQVSDRWALQALATMRDVGQYTVLFQLGYVPIGVVFSGLMTGLLAPILYQQSGDATDRSRNASAHRTAWRIVGASLAATVFGFIMTLFFHDWLFRALVAADYRSLSMYLPWVVMAGGLFATGQMLSLKLMSEVRVITLLWVKAGTSFLGVAANILGAWLFGMAGVVVGLLIFSFVYLIWMSSLARHFPNQSVTSG